MQPILKVNQLSKSYGAIQAIKDISFDLYPGQVLGIVGESGSGKSTLLNAITGNISIDRGEIIYVNNHEYPQSMTQLSEVQRLWLIRTEWGFVQQNPRDGLLMKLSAGANIAERLLDNGIRNYSKIREEANYWLQQVEINTDRIDDPPSIFSGGMQQRLQLARVLVTRPRLVLMDEPTGGLDASVQARLLDLLRSLVRNLRLSVIIVTHDIGIVRLLAHCLLVMHQGKIVESGLTDQVLDDPQHPYTQLLVSATLSL